MEKLRLLPIIGIFVPYFDISEVEVTIYQSLICIICITFYFM